MSILAVAVGIKKCLKGGGTLWLIQGFIYPPVSTFRGPKHYRGNNNKIKYGIAYL